ncbi:MAG: hypothetical protein IT452_06990, partial [Planctomycetia bacterium]|nr:hypothetical protein [Planctomycetia bacterium]
MRRGVAAGLVTAALGLAGAAAALFAPGCDGEPAAPGRTAPPPALRPPTRNYVFRW